MSTELHVVSRQCEYAHRGNRYTEQITAVRCRVELIFVTSSSKVYETLLIYNVRYLTSHFASYNLSREHIQAIEHDGKQFQIYVHRHSCMVCSVSPKEKYVIFIPDGGGRSLKGTIFTTDLFAILWGSCSWDWFGRSLYALDCWNTQTRIWTFNQAKRYRIFWHIN